VLRSGPIAYADEWPRPSTQLKEQTLATPNYSFEKRQRELAKKRKLEEKKQRKLHRPEGGPAGQGASDQPPGSGQEGQDAAPPSA